jgi:hypothetical protein
MDGNLYLKDMTGAAIGTASNPLVVYATGSTGVSSLSALTDVLIVTPASGQSLLYSATDSKWHNGSIAGSGDMMKSAYATVSESTVDNSYALNGHADTYFATAAHNHNVWDLTGYATLNADTLDGYDSTYFATTGDLTGYSTTAHTHAHNDTTSKQGGTTDEYYHLTQTQNASVAAWDVATSTHNHNIWTLTGYATINADTLDGEHAAAFATALHIHAHNDTTSLQGGQTDQYYHLNATSYASVIAWAVGGGAHNTLTGLQGGTTNEYYHLTSTQYASVSAWDVATAAHNHTGTYLPIAGKAADSELLDGQDSTYYATTGSLSDYATVAHTHATYVVGPDSALNNYYAVFDSFSGKLIKYASLFEGTNGVSILPGQTYQINGTALTYTHVGAAAAAHTHAHNDTTSLQGGTTGEYYHLSSTSYASVAAWNVAAASRLTAVSTSFSFPTTSNDDGLLQQTVNLGANFGQIVRVRVWADQTMGQRTAGTVLINNASGIDPSTTSMAYDGLVGTLPTAGAEGVGDYIWIDNELCRVSAGTSTPLTIVRGLCGSMGAFHDDNAVVTTANDGLRIALFQTATSYPAESILDMRKVMTGKFTTDAAITAGDKLFTLSSSPAVLADWGYGDLGLIDDTSDEYFRVQKTYGAVVGTTYDDSVAVLNALAAHDTSKTVYRVVEYTTPIPFKFSGSATTLYLDIYAHQLLPGATTVYLEFLIDKWS